MSHSIDANWEDRLRIFADHASLMKRHIQLMSDGDLDELIAACQKPTRTNCGWVMHAVAPLVHRLATDVRNTRPNMTAAPTVSD